ncbi:hypothetical protein GCM10011391_17540 [Pullulanibacillus camelliae]|uniref:Uncharacterized protein n=1 Tax=Pullulanibacillus camelliae TaxID=1707096 RepID=A0A8J2VSK8_9BACL|nr:hypothetical protein GCM10011391_17540 [Pullulanibacillus camelliae]
MPASAANGSLSVGTASKAHHTNCLKSSTKACQARGVRYFIEADYNGSGQCEW